MSKKWLAMLFCIGLLKCIRFYVPLSRMTANVYSPTTSAWESNYFTIFPSSLDIIEFYPSFQVLPTLLGIILKCFNIHLSDYSKVDHFFVYLLTSDFSLQRIAHSYSLPIYFWGSLPCRFVGVIYFREVSFVLLVYSKMPFCSLVLVNSVYSILHWTESFILICSNPSFWCDQIYQL